MPTKRILYTLGEIKEIISKMHKGANVHTYGCDQVKIFDGLEDSDINNDNYLFQVDEE